MTYDHYDRYRITCYSEEFGIEEWHATPEQFATFVEQMDGETHWTWEPREWTTGYGIILTPHGDRLKPIREWAY